jgi:two-component system sensor histidine kinase KdpD
MTRGVLRVYLGAAPGVGKTFAMLDEGNRRRERGGDVVVALVETHGRPKTLSQIGDLEVMPRRSIEYRGAILEEMDVDGVLARKPRVALVDELAHTNVPGSRNTKRWQDVEELLNAGIDVISTLNIQHLESLNDVVEKITGVTQRETVPDAIVRAADQIELVDMSPEALRRRMAHGNIYPAERIDAALGNYFRPGNLGALRELALLWAADRVEAALDEYRSQQGITAAWETRERVLVALTSAPGGEALVRRAARIAARSRSDLLGVHVITSDGLRTDTPAELGRLRELIAELGGTYHETDGDDVGRTLIDFAMSHNATQLVMGASHQSRWRNLTRGSAVVDTMRHARGIDVHVIAADEADLPQPLPQGSRWRSPIPVRRQILGWLVLLLALPSVTALLVANAKDVTLASDLLILLVVIVAAGAIGGPLPGLTGAVAGSLMINYYLVPPVHTFTIGERQNLIALGVFLVVAAIVSLYVHVAARRTLDARRARAEAEALARAAGTLSGHTDPLPVLLGQLRTTFRCRSIELREHRDGNWNTIGADEGPAGEGMHETTVFDVGDDGQLVLVGPPLSPDDRHVLRSHIDQLATARRERAIEQEAAQMKLARKADELRTALLQAVSHDLRTPLANIKASISSLLSSEINWDDEQRHEFLETVDTETDRLNHLVDNLLDMSRLQGGAVTLHCVAVLVDDVVANALASLSEVPDTVTVSIPENLPMVNADPELLERAVANVVGNAIAWSPDGSPIRVEASPLGARVHLRIVDRGPGIAAAARVAAVQPFQRLGDQATRSGGNGVGLGLAVATGFVTAMGGELLLEDTPGGGLTVSIDLAQVTATQPEVSTP